MNLFHSLLASLLIFVKVCSLKTISCPWNQYTCVTFGLEFPGGEITPGGVITTCSSSNMSYYFFLFLFIYCFTLEFSVIFVLLKSPPLHWSALRSCYNTTKRLYITNTVFVTSPPTIIPLCGVCMFTPIKESEIYSAHMYLTPIFIHFTFHST